MKDLDFDAPSFWKIRSDKIGCEAQPVLIIDNFSEHPELLIEDARKQTFSAIAPYYPGIRAVVTARYLQPLFRPLGQAIQKTFGYSKGATVQECFYSLVTTRPEDLAPLQCLPHFDGVGDDKLAILHYLCDAPHGGTSFYRHRRTGFESVTNERFSAYEKCLKEDVAMHGMPAKGYFQGSNEIFEQIGSYASAFNRAIIYRGVNLHAININNDFSFSQNPTDGRLTVNTFITPIR